MEKAQQADGWSVRTSAPGDDVPLKALIFYPTEYKPIDTAKHSGQAGLRIARRGMFSVAAQHRQEWAVLAAHVEHGAQLVLRERSGRNHEITLGWKVVPEDQTEKYGPDGLAGLADHDESDLLVPWRAKDNSVLDDMSWILR